MAAPPPFASSVIEAVSAVLGDTDAGMTGSEIQRLLARCGIADPGPVTKRVRISQALLAEQERTGTGTCAAMVIHNAMNPVSYMDRPGLFEERRARLNQVLGFAGLTLDEAGQLHRRTVTSTISEAAAVAGRLRAEMLRRGAHAQVLVYCTKELVEGDCFDAVFEAVKGLGERLRDLSGLDGDGAALVQAALGGSAGGSAVLALNSLRTETERNEQNGLMNMMTGIFGAFRNPAAHKPKVRWHISEVDALDLLTTLSLVHRRLDLAAKPLRS